MSGQVAMSHPHYKLYLITFLWGRKCGWDVKIWVSSGNRSFKARYRNRVSLFGNKSIWELPTQQEPEGKSNKAGKFWERVSRGKIIIDPGSQEGSLVWVKCGCDGPWATRQSWEDLGPELKGESEYRSCMAIFHFCLCFFIFFLIKKKETCIFTGYVILGKSFTHSHLAKSPIKRELYRQLLVSFRWGKVCVWD